MPYRDRAQVESWLADFRGMHPEWHSDLTIVDDSFVPHQNSGVVIAALSRSPGITYLSVTLVDDQPRWFVRFEARETAINLDGSGVRELSQEIAALGTLCAYLQERTDAPRPPAR